jgi:hypothetical protein
MDLRVTHLGGSRSQVNINYMTFSTQLLAAAKLAENLRRGQL